MKVFIVAAPLEGRSGVYRTTYDLVHEARGRGLDWSALVGMRRSAPAAARQQSDAVEEAFVDGHGFAGVGEIKALLERSAAFHEADVVVTLITQSDIAMSTMAQRPRKTWVAFLRGMPWPVRGEQHVVKRLVQRVTESAALSRADGIWATTDVLAREAGLQGRATIVPAGIPSAARTHFGALDEGTHAVWAGRLAVDKQPELFVEAARASGIASRMFGAGPMESLVRSSAPPWVEVVGWVSPDELWRDASIFVGTSYREAFGRSAAEAALRGVPVIVGGSYGAAPLLFREADLRETLVLDPQDQLRWGATMTELCRNAELRQRASDHLRESAELLTIAASVDRMLEELAAS
ncbi:glycosyltransferase involved in cell wall biosynthesis [Agrococcus sp. UYP10]|uniref:glycosyltransferase family 4 protein n=1 Tax=Agrococcus sp. UYP10 TaxID=1756355 RepID=UPI00339209D2